MSPSTETITVNVLFFARTRELARCNAAELTLPRGSDLATLRAALITRFPDLAGALSRCRIALDEEFAEESDTIRDGATAAVIPPVSGG